MNSKNILAILLVTAVAASLYMQGSNTSTLGAVSYRTQESFSALVAAVEKNPRVEEKYITFVEEVPKDRKFFSTEQIVASLKLFAFTDFKKKAIVVMQPFIDEIPSADIPTILKEISMSDDKLDVLVVLAPLIGDLTEENKEMIVNSGQFPFSSSKTRAREILNGVKPRPEPNEIYGEIGENVLTFIIDLSGSMDYTFTTKAGKKMSRLDALKQNLSSTISEQLRDFQFFNIVMLHDTASQWKTDNVAATNANIQEAVKYINSLKTIGATNISAALELAFKSKQNLEAIYLLTDGVPNRGVTTTDGLVSLATKLVESRSPKVRINTIQFMMGGSETQSERNTAKDVLTKLSQINNGTFKNITEL